MVVEALAIFNFGILHALLPVLQSTGAVLQAAGLTVISLVDVRYCLPKVDFSSTCCMPYGISRIFN